MELKPGDCLRLGRWDGKEIEWRVLTAQGGKALLITQRAIDCLPYNDELLCSTTWKDCSLRSWLNGWFLRHAFSRSERRRIVKTAVTTADNVDYVYGEHHASGGPDTIDRIFCLSIDEARDLFADEADRICHPTRCARENGAYMDDNGACSWWLRSPGEFQSAAADVNCDGTISEGGWYVTGDYYGVRPALWLKL